MPTLAEDLTYYVNENFQFIYYSLVVITLIIIGLIGWLWWTTYKLSKLDKGPQLKKSRSSTVVYYPEVEPRQYIDGKVREAQSSMNSVSDDYLRSLYEKMRQR